MSERRTLVWVLGGCGCLLLAGLATGGALLTWYLWSPSRPAAKEAAAPRRGTPFYAEEPEAPTVGSTVYSGQLEPGRETTIRCDPSLTLQIPAGTFDRREPVTVKVATVESRTPADVARPLATYDVAIGRSGPLTRPVSLTFTHPAVPEGDDLQAGRWDEARARWIPLPLARRSPTESVVETDHLSVVTVVHWGLARWESQRSADGSVTVYVRKDADPDPYRLYSRVGADTGSQAARYTKAMDEGGYTDLSQPSARRYTDGRARRALYAKTVAEMTARIRSTYQRGDYGPPKTLAVYVSPSFSAPHFKPAWTGAYIALPADLSIASDSPEELAFNLAHEVFHACQYGSALGYVWMARAMWLMDASAEYAAGRVAWADLQGRPFKEEDVAIDEPTLRDHMGNKMTPRFIERPLLSTASEHAYESAHFLEYLFESEPGLAGLPSLWSLTLRAGTLDRSEQVLRAYARLAGTTVDDVWSEFVAFLLLDQESPARGALKGPRVLGPDTTSWRGSLPLPDPYTGSYESFSLAPGSADAGFSTLRLTLEGPEAGAHVRVYGASGPLDLRRDVPVDRAFVSGEPHVLTVPVREAQTLHVIATSGAEAASGLVIRAELVALTVNVTLLEGSTFRFQVEPLPPSDGTWSYRWEFGDPASTRVGETRAHFVDHTYGAPGEHEVRVTLLEEGAPSLEATGRVTVPSALQIGVFDATTDRPVDGARVLVQYEGRTSLWTTDRSGLGRIDDLPPRTVSFELKASAEGYETFRKTSAIDLSRDLLVKRGVRLTPTGADSAEIAPPRPAAPANTPLPTPFPTPEPTPPPPPRPQPPERPTPRRPSPEECLAEYRPRLDEVRAHNAAQDPTGPGIFVRTMGLDESCTAAFQTCFEAAREQYRRCPPGSDGTYTHCTVTQGREWLSCASTEIDCTERALAAKCGAR